MDKRTMWTDQIYTNKIKMLRKGFSSLQQQGSSSSVRVFTSSFNHLNAQNSHAVYQLHEKTMETERDKYVGKQAVVAATNVC